MLVGLVSSACLDQRLQVWYDRDMKKRLANVLKNLLIIYCSGFFIIAFGFYLQLIKFNTIWAELNKYIYFYEPLYLSTYLKGVNYKVSFISFGVMLILFISRYLILRIK